MLEANSAGLSGPPLMKFPHLCFAGLLMVVAPLMSRALVFSPTSASTTMDFGGDINNTRNLLGFDSLNGIHAAATLGNSWVGDRSIAGGSVTYFLGGSYSLTKLSLWNLTDGSGGDTLGAYAVTGMDVLFSTNGSVFTAGAPASAAFVGGVSTGQDFSFTAVNASYVRFENLTSNDRSYVGFSEIRFTGESVSEVPSGPSVPDGGSTLAVLGATLLGLVGLRRRLNRG